jgi:RNA polymerase-binding transcription factor DksA
MATTKKVPSAAKKKAPAKAAARNTARPKAAPAKKAAVKKAVPARKAAPAKKAVVKPKPAVKAAKPAVKAAKPVKPVKKASVLPAKKAVVKKAVVKKAAGKKVAPAKKPVKVVAKPKAPVKVQPRSKPKARPKVKPTPPEVETKAPPRVGPVYGQSDLDYFREIIMEKIRDANDELVSIEERLMDASSGEFHDDDSTYSLHMADQGTDAMEREKAFLFAQRERKFISHLNDALQRIASGNYGVCIDCTNLIEKGRLEAVPHARMCVSCKLKTKTE